MIQEHEQKPAWHKPEPKWYERSILFKLAIIALLILALLIPSAWIQNLITEREGYSRRNADQANSNWSGGQQVQGPVLAIPYKTQVNITGADNKVTTKEQDNILYVLPKDLHIKANVATDEIKRGVYRTTVYTSKIDLKGNFDRPDLTALGVPAEALQYDRARLIFGLTDIKGLKNNPMIRIAGQEYTAEPANNGDSPFQKGLQAHFTLQKDQGFAFSYQLDLKGSDELNFLHTGKSTDVEVSSNWAHPSFNGSFFPDDKKVSDKGFNAKWHMIYYNRPFPQQWSNDNALISAAKNHAEATFGVGLQAPIDEYRKIMRTTKYSTLIILLTFVSLFLTELIKKQPIHVFNYTLIGAAMVVYYTLLLSFAEHIGYNFAYLLSSAATIGLISWFTASLLHNVKAAITFAAILSVFYGFIFVIIQLEELSLLVGSIALFIVVATLMYFSRKINWEQHK